MYILSKVDFLRLIIEPVFYVCSLCCLGFSIRFCSELIHLVCSVYGIIYIGISGKLKLSFNLLFINEFD